MDSYMRLQKLTEPTRPALAATFDRIAEILGKTQKRPLQLQFSLVNGETEESEAWTVAVDKDGGKASQRPSKQPDVEIITRAETWGEIANGQLAPLEAFVSGRMRVRGNIALAKRIFLIDLAAEPTKLPEWLR